MLYILNIPSLQVYIHIYTVGYNIGMSISAHDFPVGELVRSLRACVLVTTYVQYCVD